MRGISGTPRPGWLASRTGHPTNPTLANCGKCGQALSNPLERGYGSSLPGFMIPRGSRAALILRMVSSSAPPRHFSIM